MRVLLLSRYARTGASSRLRSYQYLPYLTKLGIDVTVAPLFDYEYLEKLYTGEFSFSNVVKAYLRRIRWLLRSRGFDLIWLEKEALPWCPSWLELPLSRSRVPLVVDYDDALFHRYDCHRAGAVRLILGNKIDALMRRAKVVLVGNDYLAQRAQQAGAQRIELLPTVVDTSRYEVLPANTTEPVRIGWIGTPRTARYLEMLRPILGQLLAGRDVHIVAVGARPEQLKGLPIEARRWSEESEAAELQAIDIGIMPLPDEPFERGKCGYKLVQYMACGKPVVASPVGVNAQIVQNGVNGFLAANLSQWEQHLGALCSDPDLRVRLGVAGRRLVERRYSLGVTAPKLAGLLRFARETHA